MSKWICFLSLMLTIAPLNAQVKVSEQWCFEEEPVEHNGVFLPMTWSLTISEDHCAGIVEILGFQTWVKMHVHVSENKSERTVKFDSIIEGDFFDAITTGEILFLLSETENGMLTIWNTLSPRLDENAPSEGVCFIPCK